MKRIAWLTDIHLDFLSPQKVKAFCRNIVEHNPEAVLIGGDIGDARTIKVYLRILEREPVDLDLVSEEGNRVDADHSVFKLDQSIPR